MKGDPVQFKDLEDGALFTNHPIDDEPHVYLKLSFSFIHSRKESGCGRCGEHYFVWNSINSNGVIVHFCLDDPVIDLGKLDDQVRDKVPHGN